MPELSAPLRATWDVPADPVLAARCWEQLVAARVLFAELHVAPPAVAALHSLAPQLELARTGGPNLTLLLQGELAPSALVPLPAEVTARAQLLLLPPYPEAAAVPWLSERFKTVHWGVWSTAAGLAELAGALERAAAHRDRAAAVLNPPQPAAALSEAERLAAAALWRQHAAADVSLRVHDLFLDAALGRDPFSAYAGCQAGRTLAHLAADGRVLACRTLPVPVGDLRRQSLTELWAGDERQRFLRSMQALPSACAGCAVAATCGGGCRGLSPERGRDPSCVVQRRA